ALVEPRIIHAPLTSRWIGPFPRSDPVGTNRFAQVLIHRGSAWRDRSARGCRSGTGKLPSTHQSIGDAPAAGRKTLSAPKWRWPGKRHSHRMPAIEIGPAALQPQIVRIDMRRVPGIAEAAIPRAAGLGRVINRFCEAVADAIKR